LQQPKSILIEIIIIIIIINIFNPAHLRIRRMGASSMKRNNEVRLQRIITTPPLHARLKS
jgi:hypothetical protein